MNGYALVHRSWFDVNNLVEFFDELLVALRAT